MSKFKVGDPIKYFDEILRGFDYCIIDKIINNQLWGYWKSRPDVRMWISVDSEDVQYDEDYLLDIKLKELDNE